MPDTSLNRDIGRHDAKIEKLESDMAAVMASVDRIEKLLSEAKGGWRVLMLVAGVAGALGAFMTKLIPYLASAKG